MSLNAAVAVRFETDTATRLEAVSRRFRMPSAVLIRMAVDKFLDEVEKSGKLEVPAAYPGPKPVIVELNERARKRRALLPKNI